MPTHPALENESTPFIAPVTGDQLAQLSDVPQPRANPPKRRPLLLVGVLVVMALLIGSGTWAGLRFVKGKPAATPTPTPVKKRIVEPANVIPVSERPVVFITPETDGRNLTLRVSTVKKPASSSEYELEYQAGELLQGVQGMINLATLPAQTTQLMGSCSAGGKCTYHENVKGGSLKLRFVGAETYALKQEWKYIDNKAKETAFSSTDAKFQLDSADLAKLRYLVIYNSPGYPDKAPGTVVSDPYALSVSGTLAGKGTLTMRANEEGKLLIAGFDGTTWKEFPSKTDGKMVTAQVDLVPLYVVIKK